MKKTKVQMVVEALIEVAGPDGMNVDELMPYLPAGEFTRAQALKAMKNARFLGWLRIVSGGDRDSRGQQLPSRYAATDKHLSRNFLAPAHADRDDEDEPDKPLVYCTEPRGRLGHLGRITSVWQLAGAA